MTTGRPSHRVRDLAAIVAVGLGLLVAWQLIVWLGGYQPFVLPGPGVVAERWLRAALEAHATPADLTGIPTTPLPQPVAGPVA